MGTKSRMTSLCPLLSFLCSGRPRSPGSGQVATLFAELSKTQGVSLAKYLSVAIELLFAIVHGAATLVLSDGMCAPQILA